MQLGDHPGVILAQGTAPVSQDPQHRELLIAGDRPQPGHPVGLDYSIWPGLALGSLAGWDHR